MSTSEESIPKSRRGRGRFARRSAIRSGLHGGLKGKAVRKYINQREMRRGNAADVFALIRDNPGITRKQIERVTEFSWGAVSELTALLLEHGYIVEEKADSAPGAGRIPYRLQVNSERHCALGIDVNASGLSFSVTNLKNETVKTGSAPAPAGEPEILLRRIEAFTGGALAECEGRNTVAIGVAMQGVVDAETGVSLYLPHCRGWENVPLAEILSKKFGVPVYLEHDPNCVLYAYSKKRSLSDALLIRVDAGIGMSVMLDGRIQNRPGMYEIGHTRARKNGELCRCGKRGCLEIYSSARGMERRFGAPVSSLAEAVALKSAEATRIFSEGADYLGTAVGNAAYMLRVSDIVLYGEIWSERGGFLPRFEKSLRDTVQRNVPRCEVVHDGNAAAGAAMIAVERSLSEMRFN